MPFTYRIYDSVWKGKRKQLSFSVPAHKGDTIVDDFGNLYEIASIRHVVTDGVADGASAVSPILFVTKLQDGN